MSPFEPPPPPQDFHSWSTADSATYDAFVTGLNEAAKRKVGVTEEMANEMSSHITYLGTNLTARDQDNWYPPLGGRTREGLAEALQSLPDYLPQALLRGCRKAWKAFARSFDSQSEEEIEYNKPAPTDDVPDAPRLPTTIRSTLETTRAIAAWFWLSPYVWDDSSAPSSASMGAR